jgi:hypothetical protein
VDPPQRPLHDGSAAECTFLCTIPWLLLYQANFGVVKSFLFFVEAFQNFCFWNKLVDYFIPPLYD